MGSDKWLDAHYDPITGLCTFSQCIVFSDINADGDCKLIIADLGNSIGNIKLKVYKGTALMSENTILDLPTGVVSFYMDTTEPRTPAIAVASGPYIYVYKNLRPYFKFTLPTLEIHQMELEAWNQFRDDKFSVSSLIDLLESLKLKGITITGRSLHLLGLVPTQQDAFARLQKDSPLKRQTVITCLETMKKSMTEVDAISCLVLGTESKHIYILDPEAFTILSTMELQSVPVFLDVSGLYDVEFTVVVACRSGGVYSLKRGSKYGRSLFDVHSQPVGLKRINKSIVVGCMDDSIQCFSIKGKPLWSLKMPASISTVELLDYKNKGVLALLVALSNSEVHTYIDKYHVDTIITEDVVTAMKFGRFGREESSLVMITKGGGLIVKMLKRTAQFENNQSPAGPPVAQSQKLDIPKKTKLFLDQTVRERESSTEIYQQFQHDLYRLRLETMRGYAAVLQNSLTPVSAHQTEPVKLHVEVTGIGPLFKLSIHVQNTSLSMQCIDLFVTFDYDNRLYTLDKPFITIPLLVPGLDYNFDSVIHCHSDKGISDLIKIFVRKKSSSAPVITAVVNMPVSEPMTAG